MIIINRCVFLFIAIALILGTNVANGDEKSFYEDNSKRLRGWIWFEEKALEKQAFDMKQKRLKQQLETEKITSKEADKEIESLKQEMNEKRSIMIARPTADNVKNYIELEQIMWKRALALDNAYREAKFKYPNLFDKIKEPTNVHAVKLKRQIAEEERAEEIKNFAKKFDLILFSKNGCKYCHEFAPILKEFSNIYGFNTEEVSLEGKSTGLFKSKNIPALGKKLGIEATPTVVSISKDGKHAFELIRGFVTIGELEEYVSLASKYANDISNKKRNYAE